MFTPVQHAQRCVRRRRTPMRRSPHHRSRATRARSRTYATRFALRIMRHTRTRHAGGAYVRAALHVCSFGTRCMESREQFTRSRNRVVARTRFRTQPARCRARVAHNFKQAQARVRTHAAHTHTHMHAFSLPSLPHQALSCVSNAHLCTPTDRTRATFSGGGCGRAACRAPRREGDG